MKTDKVRPSKTTHASRRWVVAALSILGLVSCCLGLWYVGIPVFCAYQLKGPPPAVDFTPLRDLTWSPDNENVAEVLNLDVLDEFEEVAGDHWISGSLHVSDDSSHYTQVAVEAYLAPPVVDAEGRFRNQCRQEWPDAEVSDFVFGTEGEGQFCVSYLRPLRADAYGLCLPIGYESFVVYQKHNLVITVRERASDRTGSLTNSVIEQLVR